MGFHHDPLAPVLNYWLNVGLYAAFIAVHIVMTMPAFKHAFFGAPSGTPAGRRIYVTVSILTWLALYAFHAPVPGFAFTADMWVQFFGLALALLGVVAFYEFATFEGMDSLFGVPGAAITHTAGADTPLMTEGPYAQVRHPMYRAAALYCFA